MHHYLSGSRGQGIPVPRSKRDKALGGKGNRYQPFAFPRSFPKMLDGLCALGFAEQIIGDPAKFKRTTVKAGAKLIELIEEHKVTLEDLNAGDGQEVIVLKRSKRGHWDEGERVDYPDTATTRRFRSELQEVNASLASADIRFDATAYDLPVDVQARQLCRHFTLGRFDRGAGSLVAFGKTCRSLHDWEAQSLKAARSWDWTTPNLIPFSHTMLLRLIRHRAMLTRFPALRSTGRA
jgi:hypothetical protein